MEWNSDMSAAPKDGTGVLLYLPAGNLGRDFEDSQTTAYWHSLYNSWQLCESGAYAEAADVWPEPTHWMPLPPPPTEGTKP